MSETNDIPDAGSNDAEWEKWHAKQADQAQQDINSGVDSFDKSMLTLSSGALAVSLAFIKDIVPLAQASWIFLLLASWVAFALCIVTTVVSFLFSIAALNRHRDLLDKMLATKKRLEERSTWKTAVSICTCVALVTFLAGLVCTVVFACVNVARYNGERGGKISEGPAVTNIRNYITDREKMPEQAVKPGGDRVEKGRQPMKVVPPPTSSPVVPPPRPTK